jgi:hypothetical protein
MSRKDYIAIAQAIRDEYDNTVRKRQPLVQLAQKLADRFERDNHRFCRQRFLALAVPPS